jgi:Family of unknown function (DUF6518)
VASSEPCRTSARGSPILTPGLAKLGHAPTPPPEPLWTTKALGAVSVIGPQLHIVGGLPDLRHTCSAPPADGSNEAVPGAVDPAPKSLLTFARSTMVARLALVVVVGFAVGAATEWSVLYLPFTLEPLGNTAAPWVLVAGAVALTGRRLGESVLLAVVALIALVLGFYEAEAYRGWSVARHQVVFWSVASLAVGPLVGLAAAWIRRAGRITAAVAVPRAQGGRVVRAQEIPADSGHTFHVAIMAGFIKHPIPG